MIWSILWNLEAQQYTAFHKVAFSVSSLVRLPKEVLGQYRRLQIHWLPLEVDRDGHFRSGFLRVIASYLVVVGPCRPPSF